MFNARRLVLFALLLLSAAAACGPSGGSPTPRRNANLITHEEVQGSYFTNAYDIVQNLRPSWLTRRNGLPPGTEFPVYLDEQRVGSLNALRQVEKNLIREIRYIDPNTAT
ncbi:MAG TPA: hypothetical protein VFQ39_13650, partial [Longimicrobium sp.]|nr:hypothetical protein [Longimicrobium sp.]